MLKHDTHSSYRVALVASLAFKPNCRILTDTMKPLPTKERHLPTSRVGGLLDVSGAAILGTLVTMIDSSRIPHIPVDVHCT